MEMPGALLFDSDIQLLRLLNHLALRGPLCLGVLSGKEVLDSAPYAGGLAVAVKADFTELQIE